MHGEHTVSVVPLHCLEAYWPRGQTVHDTNGASAHAWHTPVL